MYSARVSLVSLVMRMTYAAVLRNITAGMLLHKLFPSREHRSGCNVVATATDKTRTMHRTFMKISVPVREEPQHTNTRGTNPAGQTALGRVGPACVCVLWLLPDRRPAECGLAGRVGPACVCVLKLE